MPGFSSRGVFLSYRREDAAPYARLLQFQLKEHMPDTPVFMDVDSIEAGLDFAEAIADAVDSCVVLVALIGRQWATLADEDGHRRLDNPDDLVRFEVQTALERGVRVIPVLVDGAKPLRQQQLPPELQRLARLNALELSYGRYQYDADQLLQLIQRVITAASEGNAHEHVMQQAPRQDDEVRSHVEQAAGSQGSAEQLAAPHEQGIVNTDAFESAMASAAEAGNDLVTGWQLVDQREGQAYQWPELLEHYDRYDVYKGETRREGTVFIALGWTVRRGAWGMDRIYVVSFLSRHAPQTPVTEFLATDDYAETRELVAIIRGSGGGRKMYGPGEDLPPVYARFRIVTYRDRVRAKGSWNKLAVVAAETDTDAILNHALIQARRRGDL